MQQEMLLEIAKRLGRKYNLMNEIYVNTKELGDALSGNDRVSAQLILQMRQESIDQFETCNREIHVLLGSLSPGEQGFLKQWMDGEEMEVPPEFTTEVHLIAELSRNLRMQIKKTIELDRQVNTRLAGKDSFYSKEKK